MLNPLRPAALALVAALALTGCGADVTSQADGRTVPPRPTATTR